VVGQRQLADASQILQAAVVAFQDPQEEVVLFQILREEVVAFHILRVAAVAFHILRVAAVAFLGLQAVAEEPFRRVGPSYAREAFLQWEVRLLEAFQREVVSPMVAFLQVGYQGGHLLDDSLVA